MVSPFIIRISTFRETASDNRLDLGMTVKFEPIEGVRREQISVPRRLLHRTVSAASRTEMGQEYASMSTCVHVRSSPDSGRSATDLVMPVRVRLASDHRPSALDAPDQKRQADRHEFQRYHVTRP